MTDSLKHHFPAANELHWFAELARRGGGERRMRPWTQLPAEAGPEQRGDEAYILRREPEHLREDASMVDDSFRRFIERQYRAIPDRNGRMQLDWVVCLNGSNIGLVKLDRRRGESGVSVAALALQAGPG